VGHRDFTAWARGIGIAIMWPSRERLDTRHERGGQAPRDSRACDDSACDDDACDDNACENSGSANGACDNSANPPASSLTQP